jgi:DNA-binding NarL/FixJ family response regulator
MSSPRLRVVVVDDHQLFRSGVKAELSAECEVVGEAADPAEAIAVIGATSPDVVLLDVHIPDGGGVAVLRALQGSDHPPAVLALSVSDAAEDVVPMIRAGALGYVTKTIEATELVAAINRVAAGDAYFSPRLAAFVLQEFSAPEPPRVQDPSLETGYSYKRIGARLDISARTVESHVGAVLRKLQLTSRHEVAHWAASRGLIDEDEQDEG